MTRTASIDAGSNTFRILIADVDHRTLRPLVRDMIITRMAQGLGDGGRFHPEAWGRGRDALRKFAAMMTAYRVEASVGVATSAFRRAADGPAFVSAARDMGIKLDVISGTEEAELTLAGVRSVLSEEDNRAGLLVDVGGGSTELIAFHSDKVMWKLSLRLGAVGLWERFITTDPPYPGQLVAMSQYIQDALTGANSELDDAIRTMKGRVRLIGTAGTATTLAAMDLVMTNYDPAAIDNHLLTYDRLQSLYHRMASLPAQARLALPGLYPGREDIILSGAAVVLEVMTMFGCRDLRITDAGLLEGIILNRIAV
ncbi:MAG: exopolyphosphatase [Deltaproteobacteria bacterium]|nr:exopolyphosphatase [Deltaproteobacteria bacterium]